MPEEQRFVLSLSLVPSMPLQHPTPSLPVSGPPPSPPTQAGWNLENQSGPGALDIHVAQTAPPETDLLLPPLHPPTHHHTSSSLFLLLLLLQSELVVPVWWWWFKTARRHCPLLTHTNSKIILLYRATTNEKTQPSAQTIQGQYRQSCTTCLCLGPY